MDEAKVGPILGKLPSGLYIATSTWKGEPIGMLCSFVEQAGFRPPMVSIAVAPGRLLEKALDEHGNFAVNVISEENPGIMKPFTQSENDTPFDEIQLLEDCESDLPLLADSLGYLVCKATGSVKAGDHRVFVAEVLDGQLLDKDGQPTVRVRRNGFGY